MDIVPAEPVGEVPTHDDEVALGEVLDVHHPPDQRQPVGRQGEDRADEQTIEEQLNVEQRRLNQKTDVVKHGRFPGVAAEWKAAPALIKRGRPVVFELPRSS